MRKNDKGITLIILVVTIVVMLILAGITLTSITDYDSVIIRGGETVENAQRESIIQKIEADLYNEKVKKGRQLTKDELKMLIEEEGYADISNINEDNFITKNGNYTIQYTEIVGWKEQ